MRNSFSTPGAAGTSRRSFLKTTAALTSTVALGQLAVSRSAHAAGTGGIRIGLIGCGGRGTGAAVNAMNAGKDVKLIALADVFPDKIQAARQKLKSVRPEQVSVPDDHCFSGFDAYQQLIGSGVDVVLIAPSSHFIPVHLRAAVAAGKHVFCEKPHGIDMPGIEMARQAGEEARAKKLSLVSGLCWRYDPGLREGMQRVLDGAIGEILAIQSTYVSAPYYANSRKPEWSEFQFQMRNWYHFNWLSGDQTAQQLVHSLDKASWALGDKPPVRLWGMGGRQTCLDQKFGDQLDHQAVVFEYPNGVRVYGFTRDQESCYLDVSDYIIGTKGRFRFDTGTYTLAIEGEKSWACQPPNPRPSMYDVEHKELFDSVRSGKPINNTGYMCLSSQLAAAAQIAIYSGQALSWERALSSKRSFSLPNYAWDLTPPVQPGPDGRYPTAMPGKGQDAIWQMNPA